MFMVALIAILIAFLGYTIQVLRSKNVIVKLICMNSLGTLAVLFIAVHGYWDGRPDFMDNSLSICILSILGMLAVNRLILHYKINPQDTEQE